MGLELLSIYSKGSMVLAQGLFGIYSKQELGVGLVLFEARQFFSVPDPNVFGISRFENMSVASL